MIPHGIIRPHWVIENMLFYGRNQQLCWWRLGARIDYQMQWWLRSVKHLLSNLWYKLHLSSNGYLVLLVGNKMVDHSCVFGALHACQRCSNYTFILDLTTGPIGLGRDNCKTRQEKLKCWDLVHLIIEVWQSFHGGFRSNDDDNFNIVFLWSDSFHCEIIFYIVGHKLWLMKENSFKSFMV